MQAVRSPSATNDLHYWFVGWISLNRKGKLIPPRFQLKCGYFPQAMLSSSHRELQSSITGKIPASFQINLNQDANGPFAENVISFFPKKNPTRISSETK